MSQVLILLSRQGRKRDKTITREAVVEHEQAQAALPL
jgi:hypothetical protein